MQARMLFVISTHASISIAAVGWFSGPATPPPAAPPPGPDRFVRGKREAGYMTQGLVCSLRTKNVYSESCSIVPSLQPAVQVAYSSSRAGQGRAAAGLYFLYEAGTPKSFPGLGPLVLSREFLSDRKSKNIVMLSAFQLGGLQGYYFARPLIFESFWGVYYRDVIVTFMFLFIFRCSPPRFLIGRR